MGDLGGARAIENPRWHAVMCGFETDRTLVQKAISGDRPALEQLLVSRAGGLSNYIARRLPNTIAAVVNVDDVLQQCLFEAFVHIGSLRPETTINGFAAWLRSVADLRILDELKAAGRQKRGGAFHRVRNAVDSQTGSLVDLIEKLPGEEPTASRVLSRDEALQALRVGIAGLPDDQREALRWHLLQGKTLDETASQMNRTNAAVRGLVHRAKVNLAEAMGRASLWMSSR